MTTRVCRPFYSDYAWAYDLIIDRPVRKECATIVDWLVERGIVPGATVLDAGCGTGRYSVELGRRGYVVRGVDTSPDLIEIARARARDTPGAVSFSIGDVRSLSAFCNGILCRGVLNDIPNTARDAVFSSFARSLPPRGVLIADVREWNASADRKSREPLFRKRVATDRGELEFTSVTELDHERRSLLIAERHTLVAAGQRQERDYEFVMHCWTRSELHQALADHGFHQVALFGGYDPRVEPGVTDRLVAVARCSSTAAAAARFTASRSR